jgi:hypothetical protein
LVHEIWDKFLFLKFQKVPISSFFPFIKFEECSPSIQIGVGITKIDDVANIETSHTINLFEGVVINLDGRTIFLHVKIFKDEIETL